MNSQHILLLLLLVSGSTHLYAMRATNSFLSQLASGRAQTSALRDQSRTVSAVIYCAKRSYSCGSISQEELALQECLKHVKKSPDDLKTRLLLEKQPKSLLQLALKEATKDCFFNRQGYIALLQAGASVNMRDTDGKTFLHRIAQASENYYDETELNSLFTFLAAFEPDFTVRDNQDKSPRDYAPEKFKYLFKSHKALDTTKVRYTYRD